MIYKMPKNIYRTSHQDITFKTRRTQAIDIQDKGQ